MGKGKLIAIEGTDGSGKHTQTALLCNALTKQGVELRQLSFPCYDSPSSSLVKMYLGGEFGEHANDVNAYAASTFYAVDRYASYKTDWGSFYDNGGLVITDRYTISNAIHQGSKLKGKAKEEYLKWLYEFEYQKMGIPAPDLVIYLDVPAELTARLRAARERLNGTKPDIHEKDMEYLRKCRESSLSLAAESGWKVIHCEDASHEAMRSVESIHEEVLGTVKEFLNN